MKTFNEVVIEWYLDEHESHLTASISERCARSLRSYLADNDIHILEPDPEPTPREMLMARLLHPSSPLRCPDDVQFVVEAAEELGLFEGAEA